MVDTMPSPTRAMIVSSPAPPTRRAMLVRTVTRALASTWMPSLATAAISLLPDAGFGQSITLGVTLVRTASSTSRPARSIDAAVRKSSGMPARSAAIRATHHALDVAAGEHVRLEVALVHVGDARLHEH
jgi:hypothetical protein